jgi:ferredoxin
MRIQDRVFMDGPYTDPTYTRRRESAFIIAINCTQAAPTCFCESMKTGPRCREGFDIALTETGDGFVVEAGSEEGASLIHELPVSSSTTAQQHAAEVERQRAIDQMTRRLDTDGIRDLLLGNVNHPQWEDVATRCLSCSNCTMVCPTCFCSTVEDVTDLTGDHVTRERRWESCFNIDFSYMNGGVVRNSIRSRYRQWLTHKLATWHDQFGTSGCVGCGRCITWCPTGIDLTAEVAVIRASNGQAVLSVSETETSP